MLTAGLVAAAVGVRARWGRDRRGHTRVHDELDESGRGRPVGECGELDQRRPGATSVACIPDVGAPGVSVDITLPGSITVAGIDNAERIIQPIEARA